MEVMKINLRGTVFITSQKKLQSHPDTTLALLTHLSDNYNTEKDEYFFDRNPAGFHNVLDFYTTSKLHMPYTTCAESFREEMAFWGIPLKSINKCCWKTLYQLDEDMDVLEKILVRLRCGFEETHPDNSSSTTQLHRLRVRIWRLLTEFQSSNMAKVWHFLLAFVMSISILTYALQTLEEFRVDRNIDNKLDSNTSSAKIRLFWNTSPHPSLVVLDFVSNGILTLEFVLRMFTCPSLKTFLRSLVNIIELLSCVGIWLSLTFERFHDSLPFGPLWIISCVFGFLYSFRILRVLRLVRHNCGMQILFLSIKSSSKELCLLVCAFGCFVIIFAGFIYVSELQANTFSDLFVSMWWSVITMTTVGYGDHFPATGAGYVVGTLCSLVGILLIALPVAITSSNFHDFYKFNKYRIRHLLLSEKQTGLCSKQHISGRVKVKPIDINRRVAFT